MATKRSSPKDFDAPSVQLKQPRLEQLPQGSSVATKPVSIPPQSSQRSPVPTTQFPLPAVSIHHGALSASVAPTQIIGVTKGIISSSAQSPGKTSFDFHSSQVGTSSSSSSFVLPIAPTPMPPRMTHTSQLASNVTPPFVVSGGMKQHRIHGGFSQAQFMHGGLVRPTLASPAPVVSHNPLIEVSSGAVVTPQMLPAPPPPYFTASPAPVASGIVPGQIATEPQPGTEITSELTCSSPSQFLHPPMSVCVPSTAHESSSTSSTVVTSSIKENRQPICLFERRISINGKDVSDVDHKVMKLRVLKYRRAKLASLKLKHEVQLKEKFFLETGGNMMDIVTWKKRPNSKRDKYLKMHDIDSEASHYDQVLSPDLNTLVNLPNQPYDDGTKPQELKPESAGLHKNDGKHPKQQKTPTLKSEEPVEVSISSTTIQIPLSTASPSLRAGTPASPVKTPQFPTPSPRPATRLHSSFSSIYETSHEDIVMRARHEAEVMRAIAELRKEGLWSASRLPKVQEPQRRKTHWDYLLEEMQWLATDFANERRWKINAARKVSFRSIQSLL